MISFFKKYFIYLFMKDRETERETDRERERGRDTGRGRSRLHAGSLTWDSIPGLQDHDLSQRETLTLSSPVPLKQTFIHLRLHRTRSRLSQTWSILGPSWVVKLHPGCSRLSPVSKSDPVQLLSQTQSIPGPGPSWTLSGF